MFETHCEHHWCRNLLIDITPEILFEAWRKNFASWCQKYYGKIWEIGGIANKEWTEGVIEPFILTGLAPALGCRVKFHQADKKDAVLFDEDSKELCHIEHENALSDVTWEIPKLIESEPSLKWIISYGDSANSVKKNMEQLKRALIVIEPTIHNSLRNNPNQQWLFICGVNYDFDKEDDWRALKFINVDGNPKTLPLEPSF